MWPVTAPISPYVVLALGGYDTTSPTKQVHPMFMISGSADTVAVHMANGPEAIMSYLAVSAAGAALVPIPSIYGPSGDK